MSFNIDGDLEKLNKQRVELNNDDIFVEIEKVKNNIKLNELLDEDQKKDLKDKLEVDVENKIE